MLKEFFEFTFHPKSCLLYSSKLPSLIFWDESEEFLASREQFNLGHIQTEQRSKFRHVWVLLVHPVT